MKKLTALLLAVAMVFTCVACGNSGNTGNGGSTEIKDATEILTKSWEKYMETVSEDYQFPVGGGDFENMVMDTAGKYDVTVTDGKESLVYSFCIPESAVDMTDDIATVMNMMMANNFSAAAYHIADKANVETVIAGIKDATLNNQWMCGFPDKLIIATVNGEYVVSAFGNGEVIDYFKEAITAVYGSAAVVSVEENLAE